MEFIDIINETLTNNLLAQNIRKPSPVQEKAIPLYLEKKDLIVSSETGTGKTLAFLLPVFMMIDSENKNPQGIVLAPTHELASQIYSVAEELSHSGYEHIKPCLIIGGANIYRQIEKLKEKPRLIIGSVGRMLELIDMKKLKMHFIKHIIIDEADRILSNNATDVEKLIKSTQKDRQISLFSASISGDTIKAAESFMNKPETINIQKTCGLPDTIKHYYIIVQERDKVDILRKIFHSKNKENKTLIFMENPDKISITFLTEKLKYHKIRAVNIFGDALKNDRRIAMSDFKEGKADVMISSDLAARGIDLEDLTFVVNYTMPETPDIYLHRAGRCGRMGKSGVCISFIHKNQKPLLRKIEKQYNIKFQEKIMSEGELKNPVKDMNTEDKNNINGSKGDKNER